MQKPQGWGAVTRKPHEAGKWACSSLSECGTRIRPKEWSWGMQMEPLEVCPGWSAHPVQVALEWLSCASPSSFCLVCILAGSNHQRPQALRADSEDPGLRAAACKPMSDLQ